MDIDKFMESRTRQFLMGCCIAITGFIIFYIFDHWKEFTGQDIDHQFKIEKYKGELIK